MLLDGVAARTIYDDKGSWKELRHGCVSSNISCYDFLQAVKNKGFSLSLVTPDELFCSITYPEDTLE